MQIKVGDTAILAYLDINTALIGEYNSVRILKIEGSDILIGDKNGTQAWVTEHHLDFSEEETNDNSKTEN